MGITLAEEIVAPGGPSAPAWAFFTAITLALLGILGQQLAARKTAKDTRNEAVKARQSAAKAEENTTNVSNGFVSRMDHKLDTIINAQRETDAALREHLAWHLNEGANK